MSKKWTFDTSTEKTFVNCFALSNSSTPQHTRELVLKEVNDKAPTVNEEPADVVAKNKKKKSNKKTPAKEKIGKVVDDTDRKPKDQLTPPSFDIYKSTRSHGKPKM